jgi:UDP-N-acetylglucosamine 2-epimerase (non-hydrolysing)
MKIAYVLGTRPEIIKLAPILKKTTRKNSSIIFTGQHYDFDMSLRFIEELGIRKPDYEMKLTKIQNTTSDRATQTGEIILKLAKIISLINPDSVVVQGDTNTVLAAAITSIKCGIPVSHVEAGLRSYDWRMPEEHNRIAVDHISEILFAPTLQTKKILEQEHVHGQIHVTGNTSIDAVSEFIKSAEKKSKIKIKDEFVLATIHRGENVDNKKTLQSIFSGLLNSKANVILPSHPRTIKKLQEFGLYEKIKRSKNLQLIPSVGYFDMLNLMKNCTFIVTDSGGIQEEATSPLICKKVLIVRKSTDRQEAVDAGLSEIIGTDTKKIIHSINKTLKNPRLVSRKTPYGDGTSSKKILQILKNNFS